MVRYRIDIAHPLLMIGVEVDGESHYLRKDIDMKRDEMMRAMGWTILRFRNEDVMRNLNTVFEEVMSVVKSITSKPAQGTTSQTDF